MTRLAAALLAAALLFAADASAQPAGYAEGDYLENQVLRLLDAANEESKATALHLIIYYESRDANQEDTYSFSAAAPQLVEIIERTQDEKSRILAETALHLTDEKTWKELGSRTALTDAPAARQ